MAPPLDPIAPLRAALRGHYEIEREIGQGAFATVYLARDLKHERKVAIKVLLADPASDTGELRFIREIRMLARLQHPNILPLHDSGHVESLLYYVMPYVQGETLRERIERERQLDPDAAARIARDVADALAYAHGQGIIHRDIKPENILLSAGHPILADFGIARVIDLAGVKQLTRTGNASPGTPAYMSPEQLLNDEEVDGRSDTYSLGCVLFEMLTGAPPFSGKEGFVKRFTEAAPLASNIRKNLPGWYDEVLSTAMARRPTDRFQTAYEFAAAIGRYSGERKVRAASDAGRAVRSAAPAAKALVSPESLPSSRGPRIKQFAYEKRFIIGSVAALLLLAGIAAARGALPRWRSSFFAGGVDSTRLALLPFSGDASRADRERMSTRVYGALGVWRGLPLVSYQDVSEAVGNEPPKSTHSAAELARRVGAGRFVWGQVSGGPRGQMRLELYDVSSSVARRSIAVPVDSDSSSLSTAVAELLKSPGRPATADGGDGRTMSFPAWTAYALGHTAIANGDFGAAEQNFRNAAEADPDFGPSHLWLAQTLAWTRPAARQEWQYEVARASHARSGLSPQDVLVATALTQMAERRYPDACATYSRMVEADSLDFVGLFGIGQCRVLDSLVIPSAASQSRWAFRSRYWDAANAFAKAVNVNPTAHSIVSFDEMQQLLPITSTKTRRGANGSGVEFAAYPLLQRDTVVFVPYPLNEFSRLSNKETATQQSAALSRNLDILLDFVRGWTRVAPQSAPAYQALGDVLEARGEIVRNRSAPLSAVQAISRARELATTEHDRLRASTSAAWLLVKTGQFREARALSDSILSSYRNVTESASELLSLAALTGKVNAMADLARPTLYANDALNLPVQVLDAAAPFFTFAALGVCGDTTERIEKQLDDQIAHYVAQDDRSRVADAVKTRPLTMLASCSNSQASLRASPSANRMAGMQQALASGDSARVRAMLAAIQADARRVRPGDISLDFTYQSAWLRSASGDTAGAANQLDAALGALASIGAAAIREPASAAAIGRAMAFRSELAAARGEDGVRTRWAKAVADLWETADLPLQPVVTRMRSLASPRFRH